MTDRISTSNNTEDKIFIPAIVEWKFEQHYTNLVDLHLTFYPQYVEDEDQFEHVIRTTLESLVPEIVAKARAIDEYGRDAPLPCKRFGTRDNQLHNTAHCGMQCRGGDHRDCY